MTSRKCSRCKEIYATANEPCNGLPFPPFIPGVSICTVCYSLHAGNEGLGYEALVEKAARSKWIRYYGRGKDTRRKQRAIDALLERSSVVEGKTCQSTETSAPTDPDLIESATLTPCGICTLEVNDFTLVVKEIQGKPTLVCEECAKKRMGGNV